MAFEAANTLVPSAAMDPWQLARIQAVARGAFGVALMFAPGPIGRPWVGRDASRASSHVYSAAMGSRDVGLALGVLDAVNLRRGARPWLAASVLADSTDLLVTLRNRDRLPAFGVASVAVMAASSAVLGAWLRQQLD